MPVPEVQCKSCGKSCPYTAARCSHCGKSMVYGTAGMVVPKAVPHQDSPAVQSLPVERLRFEYEKRQREIGSLQIQLSRLNLEYDRAQDEWGQAYDERRAAGRGALDDFDASGFRGSSDYLMREISSVQARIGTIEREMQDLEAAINSKWR